jgi:hypothetical protein
LALVAGRGREATAQDQRLALVGRAELARATESFGRYLGSGYGFSVGVVGRRGIATLALDAQYLRFPPASRARPLGSATVTITTGLRAIVLSAGPGLWLSRGRMSVGAGLAGGIARTTATSDVGGLGDPDRLSRGVVNNDLTWMASGTFGTAVRLARGSRPVTLEFGLGWATTGDLRLVREENLPIGVISGVYLPPTPTAGSWLTARLGLSVGLGGASDVAAARAYRANDPSGEPSHDRSDEPAGPTPTGD